MSAQAFVFKPTRCSTDAASLGDVCRRLSLPELQTGRSGARGFFLFGLDSVQAHMWDWLTGWSALEQWAEMEKQRIAEDASKQITEAFKARAA